MARYHLVSGLPSLPNNLHFRDGCFYGKHSNTPSPKIPATRATTLLALVHSNLCGPMATPSLGGAYYFVLFLDDYSDFTTIFFSFFFKKKSEFFAVFPKYHCQVITQFSQSLLILWTDNSGKLTNKVFSIYYELLGINRHFMTHTPCQSGLIVTLLYNFKQAHKHKIFF